MFVTAPHQHLLQPLHITRLQQDRSRARSVIEGIRGQAVGDRIQFFVEMTGCEAEIQFVSREQYAVQLAGFRAVR